MTDAHRPDTGAGAERDAPDEPLSPSLRRAVDALRPLPPTPPDAVAHVVAAAQRGATIPRTSAVRARTVRRRTAGVVGVAAAALALFVRGERERRPRPAVADPRATAADAAAPAALTRPAPHGTPVIVARANAAAENATISDAPQIVHFRLDRPGASAVAVLGDFNAWTAHATPLARDAGGAWTAAVSLTPGRHAYRFVVDDTLRVLDPRAPAERDPELGVAHSIIVVGVP